MNRKPFSSELSAAPDLDGGSRDALIKVHQLVKVYETPAGGFAALQGIDAQVNAGEFVAIVGKSGCGKSTFINMLTGIDRHTSGEVWIDGVAVHALSENALAKRRGRNVGIVFQHFQLMPTLTLLENVILPMELNDVYTKRQRRERAMHLLAMVHMADHAHKLPSAVSGGQQQRVAIARALANDPSDGKIVNEHLAHALATLTRDQLDNVVRLVEPSLYPPGANIVVQGDVGQKFYIIIEGETEVYVEQPGGKQILVNRMGPGEYFGEMALVGNGLRPANPSSARAHWGRLSI